MTTQDNEEAVVSAPGILDNYDEGGSILDNMSEDEKQAIVDQAKEDFSDCEDNEQENRTRWLEDLQFGRQGIQWDEKDAAIRSKEGRPMLTINRMPTFIRQISNDARQNKPSIKCHPVDDKADPDTAEILNGIIRNIEVQSKADIAYDTAADSAVSAGMGYYRIDVSYSNDWTFDRDIEINRIANIFTVYGDPRSTAADTSDWNKAFITEMMPIKEFEAEYPDAEAVDFDTMRQDEGNLLWFEDNSVRVAEYWVRERVLKTIYMVSDGQILDEDDLAEEHIIDYFMENDLHVTGSRQVFGHKVMQYLMNGQQLLEANEWAGKYIPIVNVIGDEVNIEGQRYYYSLIHFAKDSQRMYNYWRTAATELVALAPKAPFIGAAGSFDSDERWLDANTNSFPFLEYDMVSDDNGVPAPPPQRQPFAGVPAGAMNEAASASDDMKSVIGLYDASLGQRSNETSGVAIRARQMEGDVSTFHFLDNVIRAIRHGGLIILDLIPHVYNEARIMRIMGEDETPENVQINQPIQGQPQLDEKGQPVLDDQQRPVMKIYDLTLGKYDVTVKAGPSFTTRRQEAATQMTDLIKAFPQAAPYIGDILAESLDWPRADEIAKRLKMLLPPNLQQDGDNDEDAPEVMALKQQIMQGMEMLKAGGAELEALKADKSLESRKLDIEQIKAEAVLEKTRIEMHRAESDRIEAQAEAQKDMADAQLKMVQAETEQITASATAAQAQYNMQFSPAPEEPPFPAASPKPAEPVVVNVHGSAVKGQGGVDGSG